MGFWRSLSILLLALCTLDHCLSDDKDLVRCEDLLMGQYKCNEPVVDSKTQSAAGCNKNHTVKVDCHLSDEKIKCESEGKPVSTFKRDMPCRYTNGYSYKTALLLSIFLGMFGIDRFYLGYPAIGLLKFCTLGFFFLFQLIDILLIATQVVGPADESEYVIDYYGPRLIKIGYKNDTFQLQ